MVSRLNLYNLSHHLSYFIQQFLIFPCFKPFVIHFQPFILLIFGFILQCSSFFTLVLTIFSSIHFIKYFFSSNLAIYQYSCFNSLPIFEFKQVQRIHFYSNLATCPSLWVILNLMHFLIVFRLLNLVFLIQSLFSNFVILDP